MNERSLILTFEIQKLSIRGFQKYSMQENEYAK